MHTDSGNFALHQLNKQSDVSIAGANALGNMGAATFMNTGNGGFIPAGIMAGMAMGGSDRSESCFRNESANGWLWFFCINSSGALCISSTMIGILLFLKNRAGSFFCCFQFEIFVQDNIGVIVGIQVLKHSRFAHLTRTGQEQNLVLFPHSGSH